MASCSVHLYNELKERKEQGEDLTEDEEKIVQAETREELEKAAPSNFGPDSEEYDGAYCSFCYRMGELGAIFFGISPPIVLASITALTSQFLPEGLAPILVGAGLLVGVIIGVPVWWSFHRKVRVQGYFPALGPDLGPYVEKILGKIGIQATATIRRDKEGFETMADGGFVLDEEEDPVEEMATDSGNTTNGVSVDKDSAKGAVNKHRSQKLEIQAELDDARSEKKRLKKQKEQLEEKVDDLEATVEGYENASVIAAGSGDVDPDLVWELNIPVFRNGDKAGHKSFYAKFFTKYPHSEHGDIWLPVGGYEKQTIKKMKPSEPSRMDLDDIQERPAYFPWGNSKDESLEDVIDQKINFLDTSNAKFNPNEDVSLVHDHIGAAEETRSEIFSPDTDFVKVSIDCGLDQNANPVPLRGNTGGWEKREELKNEIQRLKKLLRRRNQNFEEAQREIEDLHNKKQNLEQEKRNLENRLARARDNEQRAIANETAYEQNQRVLTRTVEELKSELGTSEEVIDVLEDRTRRAELDKVRENGSKSREQTEIEAKFDKDQDRIELIEEVKNYWNPDHIDVDRLGDPDYEEFEYADYIREFLQVDEGELPPKGEKLQKKIAVRSLQIGEGEAPT